MLLELTDPGTSLPILVNTDHVGHWFPYGDTETLIEFAYSWVDPDVEGAQPSARTMVVSESYPAILKVLIAHQAKPNAIVSLRPVRRRR